jgi:TldD protein
MLRDLIPAFADAVAVLERHAPYASAYARRDAGTVARVDRLAVQVTPVDPRAGFTLSAWTGDRFLETSSDDLCPTAVRAAALALVDRLRAAAPAAAPVAMDPGPACDRDAAQPMADDPRTRPASARIDAAQAVRSALLAAPHAAEAMAVVGDLHSEIVFVNRTRRMAQDLHRVRQIGVGVFVRDGEQIRLHAGHERIGGWESLADPAGLVAAVVRDGPRLLGAPRIPDPGEHDCVVDGHFAGLIAHEAFGHGAEQDLYLKDRSEGAAWLGKAVASPLVDLWDDPANGWAGSYAFDDEGIDAAPTTIIRKGVLVAGINDRLSHAVLAARGVKVAKTANGRREAYDHKPYTRMTNTAFGGGDLDLEALLAPIRHGYYLTHPSNGMEDPKGWGIQCEGAMAEEIRDGRLTGRVFGPVVMTGDVPTLLHSVTGVGREVHEASLGMCGKGYKEWVKVTDGGPALRLRAVIA